MDCRHRGNFVLVAPSTGRGVVKSVRLTPESSARLEARLVAAPCFDGFLLDLHRRSRRIVR